MKIVDLLVKNRMILDLKAKNKAEAINELAGCLEGAEEVIDLTQFLKDVFERESLSTTGIGHNIAIPHARTDAVADFVIVFGRSKSGIEFASLDNEPVNLVFLMGTPNGKGVNNYLKILAKLTRLLSKEDLKTLFYEAETPEDVIRALKRFEDE